MHILAAHSDAVLTVVAIADVVLLSWLFVRVEKEQVADEDLATPQLRRRSLAFYQHHLNDERASVPAETRSESRIADSAATTNGNASFRV